MNGAAAMPEAGAASGAGLREAAVNGAFWNVGLAAVNKLLTTGGQVVLAWFLLPADMGLVAMAASATVIATLFSASGIDDLLVQRHAHYDQDAPQVLWISLGFNVVALAMVVGLAPFAARHFGDHRIAALMVIQALSWPLSTVPLVLVPKLRNQLRFKSLALMNLGEGAVFTGTAVLLAALGFGAYALVWPVLIRVVFSAAAARWMAGPLLWRAPEPRLWPSYLGPGMLLMAGNFVTSITTQLPVFVIGSFLDARHTGLYAWGYLLASQAVFLFAVNLRGLFTPLFAQIHGQPGRWADAIIRSLHVITAVIIPVCVVQAFLARPLLLIFFPPRWLEAAPVVSWLSLGLMLQAVAIITHAALIAAGRYWAFVAVSLLQALAVGAGVLLGCRGGDVVAASKGGALAMAACVPVYFWVIHQVVGGGWGRLWDPLRSMALGVAAAWPAYMILGLGGAAPAAAWNLAAVAAYALTLIPLAFLLDPGLVRQIRGISALIGCRHGVSVGPA